MPHECTSGRQNMMGKLTRSELSRSQEPHDRRNFHGVEVSDCSQPATYHQAVFCTQVKRMPTNPNDVPPIWVRHFVCESVAQLLTLCRRFQKYRHQTSFDLSDVCLCCSPWPRQRECRAFRVSVAKFLKWTKTLHARIPWAFQARDGMSFWHVPPVLAHSDAGA